MGNTELRNESSVNSEKSEFFLEKSSFSLPLLLKEVVDELRPFADTKAVHIKIVAGQKLPRTISSDPIRLKLVLVNIIGHAIRCAQDSELAVLVDCLKTSSNNAKLLQVAVRTKSVHFSDDRLELYQTKKVAKILGGDVVLKFSTPDLGASFVATFLIQDDEAEYSSVLMH